jgi:hypothetical protein
MNRRPVLKEQIFRVAVASSLLPEPISMEVTP